MIQDHAERDLHLSTPGPHSGRTTCVPSHLARAAPRAPADPPPTPLKCGGALKYRGRRASGAAPRYARPVASTNRGRAP
ncbi:hypothetical protein GCM10010431_79530 [Streptomyces kunmingensis]